MNRLFLVIACITGLCFCKKEDNKISGEAIPSTQTIYGFEHITPIKLSIADNNENVTFMWSRDKTEEVWGLYGNGTGNTIIDSCNVHNKTNIEQIVTYTITPIYQNGVKGASFKATINIKTDYALNATVIDKTTQEPVADAYVWLGSSFCSTGDNVYPRGEPSKSDANGKFRLLFAKSFFSDKSLGNCKFFFAKKDGYVGSNIFRLGAGLPGETFEEVDYDLELYHPSTLKVRVINDTLSNSIDAAELRVVGDMTFSSAPGFTCGYDFMGLAKVKKSCIGRKFDTTYEFEKLWGNMEYKIILAQGTSEYSPVIKSYSLTLIPDELNEITVTF